ncbi:MAG: hypothetical protein AAFW73_00530 [Bacteroidota bacterium]
MSGNFYHLLGVCGILLFTLATCTKEEIITVPNNDSPSINNVPAIRIENYVNRLFIDLLGREPFDEEISSEVGQLKAQELSKAARVALIQKLQTADEFIGGDTSYLRAYHQQMYNLAKVRCLDGAGDQLLRGFESNAEPSDALRLRAVLDSRLDFQEQRIAFADMLGRMIYNNLYDELNMNTFNFVNASFDNLFWRSPTDAEFVAGFKMIEDNQSAILLGEVGQSKTDYVDIVVQSREIHEGMIIWVYQLALARRPSTLETTALLDDFLEHRDIRIIQQEVLSSNEYANF